MSEERDAKSSQPDVHKIVFLSTFHPQDNPVGKRRQEQSFQLKRLFPFKFSILSKIQHPHLHSIPSNSSPSATLYLEFQSSLSPPFKNVISQNGRQEINPNSNQHPQSSQSHVQTSFRPQLTGKRKLDRGWEARQRAVFQFVYKEYKFICKNSEMGTTQSKIKSGYQSHSTSLFTSKLKEGVKPSKPSISSKENNTNPDLDNTNSSEEEGHASPADDSTTQKKRQLPASTLVANPQHYPYSSIGLISCQMGEQRIVGTGCLIGGNFVLTCAHNIWSFREGKAGKGITFSPGFSQDNKGVGLEAKKIYIPEELATSEGTSDELIMLDYAVIELEGGDLEDDFGSLGVDFNAKPLGEENVRVVGFARSGKEMGMCELSGVATEDGHMLLYDLNTGYGMSGAPIIQGAQGKEKIVGLHVYCRQKGGHVERGGLRLDQRVLSSLGKWCARQEEELDLREKNLGREGLKYLSKHKWTKLVSLNLSRNGLQNNTGKYLRRGHWEHLKNLDLGGNMICKEGAQALAQSSLSRVATLNLWGNAIGKAGAHYLSLANWQSLTNLNLYNNDIGDQGVVFLTHAGWKRLQSLNLGKNCISLDGAQGLFQGPWSELASLNLWGNELSGEESLLKARLLEHFPLLKYLYM